MAFGFIRLPGTSRRFQNIESGETISYRQYNKHLDRLGARAPALKTSIEAIRATEDELARIRASLASREAELQAREALVAERERALELERELFRAGRQSAGQRRYNAALESYVRSARLRGRRINKREARSEPAFRQAMKNLKGRPNPKRNPTIADENRFRRRKALDTLGGDVFFRDQYESLYGNAHGVRKLSVRGRSDAGREAV